MEQSIPMIVAVLVGMIFCIVVHEYAHALVASWLGDDTARMLGRLTLNPIVHIDPFMSILLPVMTLLGSGVPFGGAKPVPIDPLNFSINRYVGMMLVAAAGPISNFILAVIFALLTNLVELFGRPDQDFAANIMHLLMNLVVINLVLGLFNLLPIPPLDGSKIVAAFLPREQADWIMSYQASIFGMLVVGVLVVSGYTRLMRPVVVVIGQWLLDITHFVG